MSDDEGPALQVSAIAQPLANEKLTKKVLKVVKKGASPPVCNTAGVARGPGR